MEEEPKEEAPEIEKKTRKPLSEEALEKLKLAREKANAKRKEMAEQKKQDKEALIQQKLEEAKLKSNEKLEKAASKEAKKRLYSQPREETKPEETKPKKKKDTVVVEYSSSDSDDIDFNEARVLFVKKETKRKEAPVQNEHTSHEDDHLLYAYHQMFGR